MSELKPCPFCGGEARTRTNASFDKNYKWTVQCKTNWCMGEMGCAFYRTEAEAIEAWNTRAERIEVYPDGESGISINGITYVPERTCKVIEMHEHVTMDEPDIAELSCGHDIMVFDMEPPNYCPNCGAKVVSE